jgi:hypothetical protein
MNSVTLTGHLYQPPSGGKHLLQYTQNFPQRRLRERTEAPHQALLIHRADLVQHHMTVLPGKPTGNPERVRMSARREWRDDEGRQSIRAPQAGQGAA